MIGPVISGDPFWFPWEIHFFEPPRDPICHSRDPMGAPDSCPDFQARFFCEEPFQSLFCFGNGFRDATMYAKAASVGFEHTRAKHVREVTTVELRFMNTSSSATSSTH